LSRKKLSDQNRGWTEEEFEGLDLGDQRLNRRAKLVMERLSESPSSSVPKASKGWSETIGAYRFFDNEQVDWREILHPHWQQTQERMRHHGVVLCLQDTTELDFNGQQAQGLGPLNYESQRGMYLHPTYAITTEREPLGVLDAWMWAREKKDAQGHRGGPKESLRWIEGYERLSELATQLPNTRLVYVADRESDILALMQRAQTLGTPVDWLIRASHNRALPGGQKLWAQTQAEEALGNIEFELPARPNQQARQVKQQVWVKRVELPAKQGQSVSVNCLIAKEIEAPAGHKPIEWRLLSNRAIETLEQAEEVIEWYRARWEIEILFNVLKNGCKVEALQLGSIERIERALALYLVVSWRIAQLMRLGRTSPDLEANLFFEEDEIQAAYLLAQKVPPRSPKLNEVLRQIACIGGFLGRKGDGEPGVKTIWLGLNDVRIAVRTIRAMRMLQQGQE
jgi:Transposase Tn5 dimerisation domain/Transposase DNA-binding